MKNVMESKDKKFILIAGGLLVIFLIFYGYYLWSKPKSLGLINSVPENIQTEVKDLTNGVENIEELTSDENIEKMIKLIESYGGEIKNKAAFKESFLSGVADGKKLKDLNPKFFTNTDYSTGYGAGWTTGCMTEKKDTAFCQREQGKKLTDFLNNQKTHCEEDSDCKISTGCCCPEAVNAQYQFDRASCDPYISCPSFCDDIKEVRCINNICRPY